MKIAVKEAENGVYKNEGGPFGAVIVKDGKVVASSHNTVLLDNDPTAHAEVNTIRKACKELNTYDLSDCILYTTSEPCPMCASAIIWSNIKTVYYGTDRKDVANIGFRDDFIYNYLSGKETDVLNINQLNREECLDILNNYKNTIY
jgi:guanine deaminase